MNKAFFGVALIVVLLGIVVVNLYQSKDEAEQIEEAVQEELGSDAHVVEQPEGLAQGDGAPGFELMNLNGEAVSLSDYKGKKVILNFWATWCPPCKAEMPHMENFYKDNSENVEILAVNLMNTESNRENVQEFIEEYGLTFPILLDESGELGKEYRAVTIPTTYMINTEGVIHHRVVGPMDEEMMTNLVDSME